MTSARVTLRSIRELLTMMTPPGTTLSSNLTSEGPFMATSRVGRATMGEAMGFSEMMTEQLAVPPRISGP